MGIVFSFSNAVCDSPGEPFFLGGGAASTV
jgi:hypothetical protein